jgi:hypothetical protein
VTKSLVVCQPASVAAVAVQRQSASQSVGTIYSQEISDSHANHSHDDDDAVQKMVSMSSKTSVNAATTRYSVSIPKPHRETNNWDSCAGVLSLWMFV